MTYEETNKEKLDQAIHLLMDETVKDADAIDYWLEPVSGRITLKRAPAAMGSNATKELNFRIKMPYCNMSIYFDSYSILEDDLGMMVQFKRKGGYVGSISFPHDCKLKVIA